MATDMDSITAPSRGTLYGQIGQQLSVYMQILRKSSLYTHFMAKSEKTITLNVDTRNISPQISHWVLF